MYCLFPDATLTYYPGHDRNEFDCPYLDMIVVCFPVPDRIAEIVKAPREMIWVYLIGPILCHGFDWEQLGNGLTQNWLA
jgi:hypothetical protein